MIHTLLFVRNGLGSGFMVGVVAVVTLVTPGALESS